jgi:hypothetical protein
MATSKTLLANVRKGGNVGAFETSDGVLAGGHERSQHGASEREAERPLHLDAVAEQAA